MRARVPIAALVLVAVLSPATATAVTIADIVALTKAGVSDPVILALIERDKTILSIAAEQLVALKNDGVSEAVVIAMLRSGRDEAPPPPAPVVEVAPAQEPNIVIVGNGPDRPNSGDYDRSVRTYYVPYAVPYVVPAPVYRSPRSRRYGQNQIQRTIPQFPVLPETPRLATEPQPRPVAPSTGIFFQGPPPRGLFFDPPPPARHRR